MMAWGMLFWATDATGADATTADDAADVDI